MTTMIETRDTREGTFTVLTDVTLNWVKVVKPVASYNGGKPQYELQIATNDTTQAEAWNSVMPNLRINPEGTSVFTLKRAAFLGAPAVVYEDGAAMEVATRRIIGNGSTGDVRISHRVHKTGRPYVTLEAIKIKTLVEYVQDNPEYTDNFDF